MTMEKILLIGGGGHCHSVIDVIEQEGKYHIHGIIDQKERVGEMVMGYGIIGCDDDLSRLSVECSFAIITLGQLESISVRKKIFTNLKALGFCLPTIVSPFAYVARTAKLGEGSVVMHHALINANVTIGKNCIINTKALVEHDAIVEDFCHISTAAVVNGGVRVQAGCFFGSNATSRQAIEVNGFVKAGSLVK